MGKVFQGKTTNIGGAITGGGAATGTVVVITFYKGNITGSAGSVSWDSETEPMLATNVQVQAQRQLAPIFDLTSKWAFYTLGQTQATLTIQRILGLSKKLFKDFEVLGDPCKTGTAALTYGADICTVKDFTSTGGFTGEKAFSGGNVYSKKTILVKGCGMNQVNVTTENQQYQIAENCVFTGLDLEYQ